jgi:hypothetical protein
MYIGLIAIVYLDVSEKSKSGLPGIEPKVFGPSGRN